MSEEQIKELEEILKSDAETDSFFQLDYLASLCLQENKQLKEVIDEVRGYIKECSSREISLDILEILDKAKENK